MLVYREETFLNYRHSIPGQGGWQGRGFTAAQRHEFVIPELTALSKDGLATAQGTLFDQHEPGGSLPTLPMGVLLSDQNRRLAMPRWLKRLADTGLLIWASLFATLVILVAILVIIFGMTSGVMIFAVLGAAILGVSGLFLLRRLAR